MAYELDFLPVGTGEKSGDAIALRWGDLLGNDRSKQFVVVIDGGTNESGKALVDHVQTHYETDHVDLVVNTHPDADHASGLSVVIENLAVKKLMLHQPWNHSKQIFDLFKDGRMTPNSLSKKLQEGLEHAYELEKLAKDYKIPIVEPFTSESISACNGTLTVLGPSLDYYRELLLDFRSTPQRMSESFLTANKSMYSSVFQLVLEYFGVETLEEPAVDATSAENNSSAILLLQVDGKQLLLTGDAGVPALEHAVSFASEKNIVLATSSFVQVPHHGSRRNVGPAILNELLGPKRSIDSPFKTAIVSASKGAPKHPSKRVTNAFRRRGAKVLSTEGVAICHHSRGVPPRAGYGPVNPLPFYSEVEED